MSEIVLRNVFLFTRGLMFGHIMVEVAKWAAR